MNENIPDPSVRRLSAYLRQLEHLAAMGETHVSSRQLAQRLNVGPAMVRRDLTLFGQFGRRGVGYQVRDLIEQIHGILGTQQNWPVVAVGAGQLCGALLRYAGFAKRGFEVIAAFDDDLTKAGQKIGDIEIKPMGELADFVLKNDVKLAILTVPASAAQKTADMLVESGILGILNFATAGLETPAHVHSTQVDITAHLEQLSFRVTQDTTSTGDSVDFE